MLVDNGQHEALGNFLLLLRSRGFRDGVLLNAVERAPRTAFVPLDFIGFAYHEMALPLPCGQQATAPLVVIEALSALQLMAHHTVLEIGTGSGWQTALIAGQARAVVSVERFSTLAEAADRRLQSLGFTNVVVAHGDGEGGLPAAAPFDRIIINAAIEDISPILEAQLTDDGMIIAPVQDGDRQFLMRYEKRGDHLLATGLGPAHFAPLCGGSAQFL